MNHRRKKKRGTAAWLFLIQPDLLPGSFRIQPLRPDPRLLPNVILEGICKAVNSAKALVEKQREAGAEIAGVGALATTVAHMLDVVLGGLVPVEVITMEEMFARAQRGDFGLRVLQETEVQKTNHRLAKIQNVRRLHGCEETKASAAAGL